MNEKTDQNLSSLPPRAGDVTNLISVLPSQEELSSEEESLNQVAASSSSQAVSSSDKSITLMSKKNAQHPGSSYFFKRYDKGLRLAEIEAYCASIAQFLATSEYVPNVRPYHDGAGVFIGVTSKELIGFHSNFEDPLRSNDLLISSSSLDAEYRNRNARLIAEELLGYYKSVPSSLHDALAPLFFQKSILNSVKNDLLTFIETPERLSISSLLNKLKKRCSDSVCDEIKDMPLEEFYLQQAMTALTIINKKNTADLSLDASFVLPEQFDLTIINEDNSIEPSADTSVVLLEQFDRIIKEKGIDLGACPKYIEEKIDGIIHAIPVQDLKNYRIIKGLGVSLSVRYLLKEGDNNNSNMSKKGQIIDFEWTKHEESVQYFKSSKRPLFDKIFRHPKNVSFTPNETDMLHFPNIKEPYLFYWPTKQIPVQHIFLENATKLLSQLEERLLNDQVMTELSINLISSVFDFLGVTPPYTEIAKDVLLKVPSQLFSWIKGEPQDGLKIRIGKDKISGQFQIIKQKMNGFIMSLNMNLQTWDVHFASMFLQAHLTKIDSVYQGIKSAMFIYAELGNEITNGAIDPELLSTLFAYGDSFFNALKSDLEVFSSEMTRRFDSFYQHGFTPEDNTHYKLLAGHPVFIFHKYKTFLKYIVTNEDSYRVFAELNITKREGLGADLHQLLVTSEVERIQEIRNTLVKMPDFKLFLKEHGQFAFELIKEEFSACRDKYSAKTKHQDYYQRLVQALDTEELESRFQAIWDECLMEEELPAKTSGFSWF